MDRKKYYLSAINLVMILSFMITTAGLIITYAEPEPIIIEKEVIVYLEPETEEVQEEVVEIIEEEVEEVMPISEPEARIIEAPVAVFETQEINRYFDITKPSGLTSQDIITMLGSSRRGMHYLADYLVEAEAMYGINALYLTAVFGFESGWGKYQTGANNIAGWKGIDGYFKDFDSVWECVMTVTEGLANSFVPDVGPYIEGVALRYCPDYGYLDTLLQIMYELEINI